MLLVELGRKKEQGNAIENATTMIMETVMDMTMKQ